MPKDISADILSHLADGPLSVEAYMAACVEAYYSDGVVFGADGDFITAPEISQVFGELIGFWLAVTWTLMGKPDRVHLVELGPGRGTLMADMLRTSGQVPPFKDALHVHLVERSPALRALQAERLADVDVTWHQALDTVPDGPALIVANEFLDALPIQQWEWGGDAWCARGIQASGDVLGYTTLPETAQNDWPMGSAPGVIRETAPAVTQAVTQMADRIMAHGGCALVIDYGYTNPAEGDSLQAVQKHKPVPVLQNPGLADLTAHVDFSEVAEAAEAAGALVHGPVAQGTWLKRLGIDVRAAQLANHAPEKSGDILGRIRRLIDPKAMGELFKVMAFTQPNVKLEGFE